MPACSSLRWPSSQASRDMGSMTDRVLRGNGGSLSSWSAPTAQLGSASSGPADPAPEGPVPRAPSSQSLEWALAPAQGPGSHGGYYLVPSSCALSTGQSTQKETPWYPEPRPTLLWKRREGGREGGGRGERWFLVALPGLGFPVLCCSELRNLQAQMERSSG